jgi:hypothetical protein
MIFFKRVFYLKIYQIKFFRFFITAHQNHQNVFLKYKFNVFSSEMYS